MSGKTGMVLMEMFVTQVRDWPSSASRGLQEGGKQIRSVKTANRNVTTQQLIVLYVTLF